MSKEEYDQPVLKERLIYVWHGKRHVLFYQYDDQFLVWHKNLLGVRERLQLWRRPCREKANFKAKDSGRFCGILFRLFRPFQFYARWGIDHNGIVIYQCFNPFSLRRLNVDAGVEKKSVVATNRPSTIWQIKQRPPIFRRPFPFRLKSPAKLPSIAWTTIEYWL